MNQRWADGHLDLAYLAVGGRDLTIPCTNPDEGCISLPALKDAGVRLAMATIYTSSTPDDDVAGCDGPGDLDGAEAAGFAQLEHYEMLEREGHLTIVRCAADLTAPDDNLKIVLLMENADPIRSPEFVPLWFDRGLRMVSLTWVHQGRYAGGNATTAALTPLGIDMIHALDAEGIIHDASHLCDASVEGLLEHARGPIVASHSNCRALLKENQRHLRDGHIRAIGERGGLIGLNLYKAFLAVGREPTIDDCLDHVEHVAAIMGRRDGVALGSDMDGGFDPTDLPADLNHPRKLPALSNGLLARGWSDAEVEGFMHANWLRFLAQHLA
jgi:membrane dipeptidase